MSGIQAGYAEVEYTPAPGQPLQGQQHARIGRYVHDPLMALAAAFRSESETVVFVTADTCFFASDLAKAAQKRFEQATGVRGVRLLIHATHSHVAPHTMPDRWGEPDAAYLERLCSAVVDAASSALDRLEPVTVFAGSGSLEHLGWNRRAMYADGTSAMHGDASRPDFVGSEGPRDPTLSVLFTRDSQGGITGVLANFSNHPNSVECENYYSADIPGEVRRLLRLMLGERATALYFTGASGNVSPRILEPFSPVQPWFGEEGLKRSGLLIAGEAAKVIAATSEPMQPELRVAQTSLDIPIRPWPDEGSPNFPQYWSEESREYYEAQRAAWPERMAKLSPMEVHVNVARIGDAAICTNPAEFFVEFGLDIRISSPARVNLIFELTDGYVGYIPTRLAFSRGGYETWPAFTSQLVPEAGEMIVDATRKLLFEALK